MKHTWLLDRTSWSEQTVQQRPPETKAYGVCVDIIIHLNTQS